MTGEHSAHSIQTLTCWTSHVRRHNQSWGWRFVLAMAGKPCKFFELCVQLPEHHPRRTRNQQDWHKMVVLNRSSRNAASRICILCER